MRRYKVPEGLGQTLSIIADGLWNWRSCRSALTLEELVFLQSFIAFTMKTLSKVGEAVDAAIERAKSCQRDAQ